MTHLPIWNTLKTGLKTGWKDFLPLNRTLIGLIAAHLIWAFVANEFYPRFVGLPTLAQLLTTLFLWAVSYVFQIIIMVQFFRWFILGPDHIQPHTYGLRLGRVEGRMVWTHLKYFLCFLVPVAATGILAGLVEYILGWEPLTIILMVVGGLATFYVMIKISFAMAATAVDHERPIKLSWDLLRQNFWRFLAVMILYAIALGLLYLIVTNVFSALFMDGKGFIELAMMRSMGALPNGYVILMILFQYAASIFSYALMGTAYRRLAEIKGMGLPQ